MTSLLVAVKNGHQDIVQLLVDHGADVNSEQSWEGLTALSYAVETGNIEIVKILLDNEVNVRAMCKLHYFKITDLSLP